MIHLLIAEHPFGRVLLYRKESKVLHLNQLRIDLIYKLIKFKLKFLFLEL